MNKSSRPKFIFSRAQGFCHPTWFPSEVGHLPPVVHALCMRGNKAKSTPKLYYPWSLRKLKLDQSPYLA